MSLEAAGIRVEGLGKCFGDRMAVSGLSFEVRPGEVFGLLGPNGAGKTTTVRMLAGLLRPSEGSATVAGIALHSERDSVLLRQRVGLLTEQPGLYDRLDVYENMQFFIRLYELDAKVAWARAKGYLTRFGLEGRRGEPVGSFSKGMRQKLAVVRALLHAPEVLFLDEPTSGLDPQSSRVVRDAIVELADEGRTLVLCSHNLAEVEQLCTRVAVIQNTLRGVVSLRELRRGGLLLDVLVEGEAASFREVLEGLSFRPKVRVYGDRLEIQCAEEGQVPDLVACLLGAGARVHSVVPAARALEEVYLELVREEAAA